MLNKLRQLLADRRAEKYRQRKLYAQLENLTDYTLLDRMEASNGEA